MEKINMTRAVMITADNGKYLRLKGVENSEELIGRPMRMIFYTSANIPELEDVDTK